MDGAELMQAVILGIVQGIAEFLPISSSGHIVIVDAILMDASGGSTEKAGIAMNVALHVGTLFSILVVYFRQILDTLKSPKLMGMIVLACIPVAIVGLSYEKEIEAAFTNPLFPAIALFATAVMLIVGQKMEQANEEGRLDLEQLSWGRAGVIGLFQCVAIIPGISRSGSTIAGGLLTGMKRQSAATFSFLIAIPPIAGAGLKKALDISEDPSVNVPALAVGAVVSFVVGLASLKLLLRLIERRKLHWFAIYCCVVATATIVWQLSK